MPRVVLVLLSLSLLLAACGDPYSHLEPEVAVQQAQEALEDGDARQAVRLFESAAHRGELRALYELALAHEQERFMVSSADGPGVMYLPIRSSRRTADRWRGAYDDELTRRVAAGDTEAMLARAWQLRHGGLLAHSHPEPTEAELQESEAIFRLLASNADPAVVAAAAFGLLSIDRQEAATLLARTAEAGNAKACWMTFNFVDRRSLVHSAVEFAESIDRAEECQMMGPDRERDFAFERITELLRQIDAGNEAAVSMRDSLALLGVFDRHPRLATF